MSVRLASGLYYDFIEKMAGNFIILKKGPRPGFTQGSFRPKSSKW
jgi:hypothetical protein